MAQPARGETVADMACIVAICFGWFIILSIDAVVAGFPSGDGFADADLIELIVIELVLGAIALRFLHARGYRIRDLVPAPTWIGCGTGLMLYVASRFASGMLIAPFMAGQASQPIDEMMAANTVTLPYVLAISVVNGTYEEVFLLGYLVRALKAHGAWFAIGVSMLVRVLYHLYQGPLGALYVLGFGIVVSIYYFRTGDVWSAVFAHMLGDFLPFSA